MRNSRQSPSPATLLGVTLLTLLVPGAVVLLRDPTWPDTAQFFTIGLVETVEELPRNPGFMRLTVRPTGPELGRVGSMILHIPGGDPEGSG